MSIKLITGFARIVAVSLLALLVSACAGGYSHFERSHSVAKAFENFRLLDGHTYYYNGYPNSPDAVVAIKEGYTLDSPNWRAIEMDEPQLRKMVESILNTPGVVPENPVEHGARIVDNQGKTIGAWYSVYILPILTFKSDTAFSISVPMTIIERPNRDRT